MRRAKQDARIGLGQHRRVVVGIAGGDDLEPDFLEASHRFHLLVRHAQVVVHQHAVGIGFELVAHQRWHAKLLHQRHGELVKRVRKNDDLEVAPQCVEKLLGTGQRTRPGNDLADVAQTEFVLAQQVEPVFHQLVVIGFVAGRAAQFRNAGTLREFDAVYRVEDNGQSIRIALSTIAKISDAEVASIIAGRPYIDLTDFVRRAGCSAPVTESAILTGAFDRLHTDVNRRDLLLHFSDLQKSPNAGVTGAQMNLAFAPPVLISSGLPDMTAAESVKHEIERLGIDMSAHMIEFYSDFLNAIGAVRSSDLLAQRSRSSVLVAGIKVAMQTPPVRSGKRVIFITLDDGYGCSDSTFFTDTQADYASTLYSSSLLLVRGITRRTGARGISLRATGAWDLRAAYESWRAKESTLAI